MINKNEWLIVGFITSCHGINGQVKVNSLSDFEERFLKPGIRWLQKDNESPRKIKLTSGYKQPGKETFIIKFEGINTRDNSEQLKNYKILVKTNKLPKLKKEEFHLLELINLQVKSLENDELKIIGKVSKKAVDRNKIRRILQEWLLTNFQKINNHKPYWLLVNLKFGDFCNDKNRLLEEFQNLMFKSSLIK